MKLKEILEIEKERDNPQSCRVVHLVQEGGYRAYEWSAWLCVWYIKDFKPTHRLLKNSEESIVLYMIGTIYRMAKVCFIVLMVVVCLLVILLRNFSAMFTWMFWINSWSGCWSVVTMVVVWMIFTLWVAIRKSYLPAPAHKWGKNQNRVGLERCWLFGNVYHR